MQQPKLMIDSQRTHELASARWSKPTPAPAPKPLPKPAPKPATKTAQRTASPRTAPRVSDAAALAWYEREQAKEARAQVLAAAIKLQRAGRYAEGAQMYRENTGRDFAGDLHTLSLPPIPSQKDVDAQNELFAADILAAVDTETLRGCLATYRAGAKAQAIQAFKRATGRDLQKIINAFGIE